MGLPAGCGRDLMQSRALGPLQQLVDQRRYGATMLCFYEKTSGVSETPEVDRSSDC